ncbi:MAG: hypothetical protein EOM87_08780 [Clostridia bacterium]|nr:hypothetical protein [Clostridia bacterium]
MQDTNGAPHAFNAKYFDGYDIDDFISIINNAVETGVILSFGDISTTGSVSASEITATNITFLEGDALSFQTLKVGYIILNKAYGEHDYWVAAVNKNTSGTVTAVTLDVLETQGIHMNVNDPGHSHGVGTLTGTVTVPKISGPVNVLTGVTAGGFIMTPKTAAAANTVVSDITLTGNAISQFNNVTAATFAGTATTSAFAYGVTAPTANYATGVISTS